MMLVEEQFELRSPLAWLKYSDDLYYCGHRIRMEGASAAGLG